MSESEGGLAELKPVTVMPVTGSLFRSGGFPVLPPTAAEVGPSAHRGARGRNGILANWGRETVKRDGSWAPGRGWAKYAALPDVRGPSGVPRSNGGMAVGPAEAAVSSDRNHHAPMARIGRASRTEPWGGGNLGWGWPDGRSWSGGKQNPERRERARAGRDGSLAWQFVLSRRFRLGFRVWRVGGGGDRPARRGGRKGGKRLRDPRRVLPAGHARHQTTTPAALAPAPAPSPPCGGGRRSHVTLPAAKETHPVIG